MYPPAVLVACTVSVECCTGSRLAKGRGVIVCRAGAVMIPFAGEHLTVVSAPCALAPWHGTVSRVVAARSTISTQVSSTTHLASRGDKLHGSSTMPLMDASTAPHLLQSHCAYEPYAYVSTAVHTMITVYPDPATSARITSAPPGLVPDLYGFFSSPLPIFEQIGPALQHLAAVPPLNSSAAVVYQIPLTCQRFA